MFLSFERLRLARVADRTSVASRSVAWAILTAVLLVTVVLAPAAISSRIKVDESDLLSGAPDAIEAERDARTTFGDDRSIVVAFEASAGNVFSATYVRDWNLFLSEILASDYLRLQLIDPMAVTRIVDPALAAADEVSPWLGAEQAAWNRRTLSRSKVLSQVRVSRSERAVLLTFSSVSSESQRAIEALVREAYEAVHSELSGSYELLIIGQARVLDALGKEIQADLLRYVPLVILVIMGLMTIIFRSWRAAAISLLEVGICILWTVGLLTAMGHSVSLMTSLLPVLLMAIGIADEIHLFAEFFRLRREKPELTRGEAAWAAVDRVGMAVTATSLTTVAAFLSFLLGDIPALRVFGFYAALGVLLSWLLTLTLVPALLTLIPCEGRWLPPSSGKSRRQWPLGLRNAALLLSVPILSGIFFLQANDGWNQNFSEDHAVVRDARWLTLESMGVHRFEATLDLGVGGSWEEPAELRRLEAISSELDQLPAVNGSISVADLLRDRRWQLGKEGAPRPSLPDRRAEIQRLLHSFRIFNEGGLLASLLDRERRRTSLWLFPVRDDYATAEEIRQATIRLVERDWGTKVRLSFSGAAERGRRLIDDLVDSQLKSVLTSLISCLIVLWLLGVNRRASLLAVASIAWAVSLQLGLMGWIGFPIGVATSCFVVLSLGIGIDYAIHLSFGRNAENRQRMEDLIHRIRANVIVVGGGLSVLMISGNPTIRSLGGLLVASMILCGSTAVLLLSRDRSAQQ